jgi:hypothetical protein
MAAAVVIGSLKMRSHWLKTRLRLESHAFALIAFREEGKQHLHLLAVLLEIPDVIEADGGIAIKAAQFFL